MALELYRKKRDFKISPEPSGGAVKRRRSKLSFVIQKHAARRLHYDFRLELNGVLLSWAVPKGPSLDPADKRLAMHVEDHPLEYGDFEGVIPAKQYGAGSVLLWDRGTWYPEGDPADAYKRGKLTFTLDGEKLHGGWTLVRTRGRYADGNSGDPWLLIKEDDQHARRSSQVQPVEDQPLSVVSGRSLDEITADADRVWESTKSVAENVAASKKVVRSRRRSHAARLAKLTGAVRAAMPEAIAPQLATLVKAPVAGADWLHEIKYDGYRMLCRIENGQARIVSRTHRDWTESFGVLARAAARLPVASAWLDGEAVVLDASGRSSFQALQNSLTEGQPGDFVYFVFDLLYLDGYDLRNVALVERKDLLEQVVLPASPATGTPGPLRYSSHVEGSGPDFFAHACKLNLEGAVSKRARAVYSSGRGRDWVKVKCSRRQEMVIGGYSDPDGSRSGFGALLLGVYEPDGTLRYSGKVGTGFTQQTLSTIFAKLKPLVIDKPPFSNPPRGAEARRAHWVRPQLVAEVTFTEWTDDGTLRHPSFQGLREDKKATDVVREREQEASAPESEPGSPKLRSRATAGKPRAGDVVVTGIVISNPEKLLYPDAGLTKRDLAEFYERIGSWILPHVRQRPLTLVRCPNGWQAPCFYQKNAEGTHPAIDRVEVQTSEGTAPYVMANTVSAVVATLQLGALELHPWGATADHLDLVDRITFDVDPDEDLAWSAIVEAAILIRTLLEKLGLESFVKTTGGKGLHVVLPVQPTLRWEVVKNFTKAVADVLCQTFPDRFTPSIARAARRGKIFIDHLRNVEGATAVAAYSLRARANAPVATPLTWAELKSDVRFDHFNVKTIPARLKRLKRDPWHDFFSVRQVITQSMMEQVGYSPEAAPVEREPAARAHRRQRWR
jgi:bifunctional non-homologous end joining protein LigD